MFSPATPPIAIFAASPIFTLFVYCPVARMMQPDPLLQWTLRHQHLSEHESRNHEQEAHFRILLILFGCAEYDLQF